MDPKSVVAIVVLCAGLFACGEMAGPGRGSAVPAHPTLALSLRALEDDIRAAVAAHGAATPVQARLFGLNRIEGFTASPQQDTVLFGSHDPSLPDIALDDLLVSLRNAYEAGPEYAAAPGVTIDPMPDVDDPWRVQIARVLGMPETAPMGVRQLRYDHDLKRISAGLMQLSLNSQPVAGVFDLNRRQAPPCSRSGGPGHSSTHRFWFTTLVDAGPRYERDDDTVHIAKPVHVQLQSEQEFLSRGRRVGGTEPQPNAKEFARAVTNVLAGDEYPDYVHLRNDFRIIEVGAVMRARGIPAAGLSYLLHQCPMRAEAAVGQLPGVHREVTEEAICAVHRDGERVVGKTIARATYSYRGGVDAGVAVRPADFHVAKTGVLLALRNRVLESRPSPAAIAWRVPL